MSLTNIDKGAVIVCTQGEFVRAFGHANNRDIKIDDDAIVLFVGPEASEEDRQNMAARAADIVKARNQ